MDTACAILYLQNNFAALIAAKNNGKGSSKDERAKDWWDFMNDRQIFGDFLKAKRNSREITVRAMAEAVSVAVGYYCDIESGRRSPLDLDFLDRIITTLRLTDEDRETFYDLAGKARSAAPPDLTGYINNTAKARIALRVAKEKATDEDWQRFINDLERKE